MGIDPNVESTSGMESRTQPSASQVGDPWYGRLLFGNACDGLATFTEAGAGIAAVQKHWWIR